MLNSKCKTDAGLKAEQKRSGFTLVEMLVSTGLLILVMTIFAEIFSLAVTAMTRQKGLANNDQQARTAFVVIDNDLKRMSYRALDGHEGIVPLVPGLKYSQDDAAPQQQGYIYLSENNPNDNTDDVFQFTIKGAPPSSSRYSGLDIEFYGKAGLLAPSGARDQPVWDDGSSQNNVSVSEQAEVVYFLRHGTLYRRMLLLRDATSIPNNLMEFDKNDERKLAQPAHVVAGVPIDLMRAPFTSPPAPVTGYAGNFYTDFDFSAHHGFSPYDPVPTNSVALFHGTLSNSTQTPNWPLGIPHFRFGHSHLSGFPREFISTDGTDNYFMGRYTHDETSSPVFQYPRSTAGNVFGRTFLPGEISNFLNNGRLNTVYSGSTRRGEDVLLHNVHSFDVELWDENANGGVGGFVDIGNSTGDFSSARKLNPNYGPINGPSLAPNRNVFDTWHSAYDSDVALDGRINLGTDNDLNVIGNGQPPFVPKKLTAAIADWQEDTEYFVGNRVIPSAAYRAIPVKGHRLINRAIYYECTIDGWSALLPADKPNWTRDVTFTGDIPDGDNATRPTTASWRLVDNRKPIRALRITILFRDPTSNQMRQETIVHSFNE